MDLSEAIVALLAPASMRGKGRERRGGETRQIIIRISVRARLHA